MRRFAIRSSIVRGITATLMRGSNCVSVGSVVVFAVGVAANLQIPAMLLIVVAALSWQIPLRPPGGAIGCDERTLSPLDCNVRLPPISGARRRSARGFPLWSQSRMYSRQPVQRVRQYLAEIWEFGSEGAVSKVSRLRTFATGILD